MRLRKMGHYFRGPSRLRRRGRRAEGDLLANEPGDARLRPGLPEEGAEELGGTRGRFGLARPKRETQLPRPARREGAEGRLQIDLLGRLSLPLPDDRRRGVRREGGHALLRGGRTLRELHEVIDGPDGLRQGGAAAFPRPPPPAAGSPPAPGP